MTNDTSKPGSMREEIEREAGRLQEDATYASKSHFNDAAHWDALHLRLGAVATLLAAAAGATGLWGTHPTIAAIISFLAAGATAVLTFQKPADHAGKHRLAGAGYADVTQKARQLRRVGIASGKTEGALEKKLSAIAQLKARLQKESPVPSQRAFRQARAGIDDGEAQHAIDQGKR